MKRIRTAAPAIALALVLALLPATALAKTYQERVNGVETSFPTACTWGGQSGMWSTFAGTATAASPGSLNGYFQIAVCRSTLIAPSGTIYGGTYEITSQKRSLSGTFTGGWVQYQGTSYPADGLCVQSFGIGGTLSNGTFSGELTHYGYVVDGYCSVFFASISGQATVGG